MSCELGSQNRRFSVENEQKEPISPILIEPNNQLFVKFGTIRTNSRKSRENNQGHFIWKGYEVI